MKLIRSAICVSDRRSLLRYFFRMDTVARSMKLLTCDYEVNTHHTSSLRVPTGPFLPRKQQILDALQDAIDHADIDAMALRRQQKQDL